MKKYCSFLSFASLIFILSACKKENDTVAPLTPEDYHPLQTGKYITYKLDSLVYTTFGTKDTTISYEAKYEVDSLITDNLGRPAYRIFRYLRKAAPDGWVPSGTFLAINTKSTFEFIENNLRFIKLGFPVSNGTTWKGNIYIDTESSSSDVQYLDDWDYTYDSVAVAETVGAFALDNVLTVHQRDEVSGDPEDTGVYSQVNFGEEKYARGIGLVYQKFLHREFQPEPAPGYVADGSYGITLTMIDHN